MRPAFVRMIKSNEGIYIDAKAEAFCGFQLMIKDAIRNEKMVRPRERAEGNLFSYGVVSEN